MKNPDYCNTSKHFTLGELVELGRRLIDSQLERMKLLHAVIKAEQEYYWRLKAAQDLFRESTGQLREEIEKEIKIAAKFAENPLRKSSEEIGNNPRFGEKRSLPQPGTIIERRYNHQHPWPKKRQIDGTFRTVQSEIFRFVVVDTPSKLIRLGEKDGGIYLSVSGAAKAATGSQTDGWRFFGIE